MFKIRIFITILLGSLIGILRFGKLGLIVPINARISGKQRIKIGVGFGAGSGLWIDAIEKYKNIKFTPEIVIGEGVSIGYSCHIGAVGSIKIQNNVLLGSRVLIIDHSHGNYDLHDGNNPLECIPINRPLHYVGPIIIERNSWIGDGVVILGNVTIGEGSIVGANSVVTKSIPPLSVAVGSPAKVIKKYSQELNQWKLFDN